MKIKEIVLQIAFFMVVTSFIQPNQQIIGKEVFEKNCSKCHGKDGTKKAFGVKSLEKSQLTTAESFDIITNGKGKMPSWKGTLTNEQINQVVEYIEELRKKTKE